MTKTPAMPINGKTFKNLLLLDQTAGDLESSYAALRTEEQPNLFKWCPWTDLDLIYGNATFGIMLLYGKKVK